MACIYVKIILIAWIVSLVMKKSIGLFVPEVFVSVLLDLSVVFMQLDHHILKWVSNIFIASRLVTKKLCVEVPQGSALGPLVFSRFHSRSIAWRGLEIFAFFFSLSLFLCIKPVSLGFISHPLWMKQKRFIYVDFSSCKHTSSTVGME